MTRNVGRLDRGLRATGAVASVAGAVAAPWAAWIRIALGLTGAYLLFTAAGGLCFGYALLGRSTCARVRDPR